MKKIIVPVDFSPFSENALRTAAFIAKKHHAKLIVVHMLELSNSLINQSDNYIQEQAIFHSKLAEKKFTDFLNKKYLEGVETVPIIKQHKIFNELKNIAKEENADLIVMGSHGVSGMKEVFIGSNTEKVVRSSTIPVLITKGLPTIKNLKNAVFACDFSDDSIIPYQKAKALMNLLNCKMQLLHISTPYSKFKSTFEQKKYASKFLEKAEGNTALLNSIIYISDYSIEKGILNYANANNTNLVVIATHGRNGLDHLFNGSISEDVANHANLPVLTIKI